MKRTKGSLKGHGRLSGPRVASLGAMLLFVGVAAAGEVVMFKDKAPAPDDLANIMFPKTQSHQPTVRMRGIRVSPTQVEAAQGTTSTAATASVV